LNRGNRSFLKTYPPPPSFQANAALHGDQKKTGAAGEPSSAAPALDEAGVAELEVLLSIPLASLALRVLHLPQYSALLACLPWASRKQVLCL
jgi:uncharacterized protein involved in exopolysaccharide biosynthesis